MGKVKDKRGNKSKWKKEKRQERYGAKLRAVFLLKRKFDGVELLGELDVGLRRLTDAIQKAENVLHALHYDR